MPKIKSIRFAGSPNSKKPLKSPQDPVTGVDSKYYRREVCIHQMLIKLINYGFGGRVKKSEANWNYARKEVIAIKMRDRVDSKTPHFS